MAERPQDPPVVAELGRPETPEETAARKAESSRKYRQRKTIQNLIAALGVSVVLMFVMVLIVPRNDAEEIPDIDFAAAAEEAQPQFEVPLVVPELSENWQSNGTEIRTGNDDVTEWYIGLLDVVDDNAQQFVGIRQGVNANDTWTYDKVGNRTPTGTTEVGGVMWDEYDYTELSREDAGNNRYVLVATRDDATYIVFGSGSVESVQEVAASIADQIPAN
ncbi:DUF4245 family protein [Gulosibacter sp. ACHW.36C]|uniref:DUF4245 domain-containing protein n=1 Tax=Gulosibacter sediminis TaxID=1729695 RepID=A0ABY4N295_9MICO|nr:DUF4245 family protein [Gulosibacter sediminis]UQN15761.1 DUF4245 domain-containing protein [Gulosibacter sediminis]